MKLAPYPEYKDSDVPWLGKVPAHWDTLPLRWQLRIGSGDFLSGERMKRFRTDECPVPVIGGNGVMAYTSESNTENPTIVIGRVGALCGNVHLTHAPSWVTDNALRLGFVKRFQLPFLTEQLRVMNLNRLANVSAQPLVTGGMIKAQKAVCPPSSEQAQIVRFLDWKTSQINEFIRNKRRLIELLKEQKQNIINQAVTRGLDPNVKLKPSGVEWIGDIPEHWEARRLKTVAKVVLGKMLKTSPSTDDLLKAYLRSANIQWFEADVSDVATMWFSPAEMKQYRILKNDILVSEGGEAGRACIWKDQLDECYIQNSVHKVTAGEEILPLFLLYQFSALGSQGVFKAVVNRVSIAHLTREKLVVLFFCKPPVEEQKIIVEYIQGKSAEIDQSIFRAQREIELMREYRTRLISDVVTGQVDVRGIKVPEVAEDELMVLEDDAAESDEVVDDEGDMDESD